MRNYIRHPTAIPIILSAREHSPTEVCLNNLSAGGLCFVTDWPVKVGAVVNLLICSVDPNYRGEGVIVWRRNQQPEGFEVGVRFISDDEYFRMRMVEQVCQIEDYRHELEVHGRRLSSEEAAMEWIECFAAEFDKKVTG
jgi:hypothetical protein